MARTIGKINIRKVKTITQGIHASGGSIDDVIDGLDNNLWDTWEMADQEIRRIVNDEWWKLEHNKAPWL